MVASPMVPGAVVLELVPQCPCALARDLLNDVSNAGRTGATVKVASASAICVHADRSSVSQGLAIVSEISVSLRLCGPSKARCRQCQKALCLSAPVAREKVGHARLP